MIFVFSEQGEQKDMSPPEYDRLGKSNRLPVEQHFVQGKIQDPESMDVEYGK